MNYTNVKVALTLKEQNVLTTPASLFESAATPDVSIPASCSFSCFAMPGGEETWAMEDSIKVEKGEQVEVKGRICDVQES